MTTNTRDPSFKFEKTTKGQETHNSLSFVADLHTDTLLWQHRGSMLERSGYGHVDVPRLIEGNVALQG